MNLTFKLYFETNFLIKIVNIAGYAADATDGNSSVHKRQQHMDMYMDRKLMFR